MAGDNEAIPLLATQKLSEAIASRLHVPAHAVAALPVVAALQPDAGFTIMPVVLRCTTLLLQDFSRVVDLGSHPDLAGMLALLTRLASHLSWQPRLVAPVVALVRRYKLDPFAPLYGAILRSSSVDMVLQLDRADHLTEFTTIARQRARDGVDAWADVLAGLRKHWPERIRRILGEEEEARDDGDGERDDVPCCPITLQPYRNPVVASDGHTYERDAIVRHMQLNGGVSPLTNQHLEYYLYPNRAL